MNVDDILNVGSYCEQLLQNPTFQFISGYFEQGAVGELLATKPHETKTRESIYARVTAHREFLNLLVHFVQQKKEATEPQPDQSDDDPTVHEIYKGIID